ncbi:MAG: isochorismatase family protein [Thaumarchaeota archaeon]|nr:isochorismatase family protein [Nitrososphaerota archaeon]
MFREFFLERSALVVIDAQKGLFDLKRYNDNSTIEAIGSVLTNCTLLVDAMRKKMKPVVYARTVLRRDHLDSALSANLEKVFEDNDLLADEGAEILDMMAPQNGDFIVSKSGHSALQFTNLDRVLSNLKVDTVLLVGGGIPGSIASTCRQAAALGYEVAIAADALHPYEQRYLPSLRNRSEQKPAKEWLGLLNGPTSSNKRHAGNIGLIIVDMQNDAIHPEGSNHRLGYGSLSDEQRALIIGSNKKLIDIMRSKELPIIYIRNTKRSDAIDYAGSRRGGRSKSLPMYVEGTWGSQIVEEIKPREDDIVVVKRGHSAFASTTLHRILRNLGVDTCIVTGGAVNGCVADTVMEGVGLGYKFIAVSDATFRPPNSPDLQMLADWTQIMSAEQVQGLLNQRFPS